MNICTRKKRNGCFETFLTYFLSGNVFLHAVNFNQLEQLQRKKDHEEKVAADMGELRNKMEVQSKLLTVQSQRMQELEKTARAAEEMVMAWKKHAEVIQMEKDEAVSIARTAQESAAKSGERTLAASKMVRSIGKKA